MLSERKHTILQSLIQEYVMSAHPVASSTLVRYYVPRLSSATVRNELSWLEENGYVVSPHTSAGRMPTTVGYRTFVNSLLLHPQLYSACVNRKDVHTHSTELRSESSFFAGTQSVTSALKHAPDKLPFIQEALGMLAQQNKGLMVFWAPQLAPSFIHRGLPLLLSHPEFNESSAALPIMQLLESHGDLMAIFEDVIETGGLHIRIGSEHKDAQLYEFSLVAMRFNCAQLGGMQTASGVAGVGHSSYGLVAFFGPTRMNYQHAIGSITGLVKDLEHKN